jgi:hypothetical protein
MPVLLTFVIMGAVAYSFFKEGIFTAFCMLINVFLAGLVAFNYFEAMTFALEPMLKGWLDGYEDALSLTALFAGTVILLRSATNALVNNELTFPLLLYQYGAAFFGLVTGYLVAGFLFCMLQTLPWHENFMSFDTKLDPSDPSAGMRRILPPDRAWLALMHRASKGPFSQTGGELFDKDGSFEWRYARYRRYNDSRDPLPYQQELDPLPPPPPPSSP